MIMVQVKDDGLVHCESMAIEEEEAAQAGISDDNSNVSPDITVTEVDPFEDAFLPEDPDPASA